MMSIRMWRIALDRTPRLTPQQWQQLDPVTRWLIACRAPELSVTLAAAALAGVLSLRAESWHWHLWLVTAAGLITAHATGNLINAWTAFRRGIGHHADSHYPCAGYVLAEGCITPEDFWRYLGCTAAVTLAAGAWLMLKRVEPMPYLLLAGALVTLLYRWPLKYAALGEPAVLLSCGPLMVGGTFYAATGTWSWTVALLSTVFACGPTTALLSMHIDRLTVDRAAGRTTLAVVLGENHARTWAMALLLFQYLACAVLVFAGNTGWPLLLTLITLSTLRETFAAFGAPKPQTPPADYPQQFWPLWFSIYALRHTRRFTALFLVGLLIETLMR